MSDPCIECGAEPGHAEPCPPPSLSWEPVAWRSGDGRWRILACQSWYELHEYRDGRYFTRVVPAPSCDFEFATLAEAQAEAERRSRT